MRVDGPTGEAAGERTTATHLLWGREDAARRLVVVLLETWLPTMVRAASPTHRQSRPRVISTDLGSALPSPCPTALSPLGRPPSPGPGGFLSLAAVPLVSPLSTKSSEPQYTSSPASFPGVAKRNKIKYVNPSLPARPILHV